MTISSPVPQDAPVCTRRAAHSAGLDVAPAPSELDAVAASIVAAHGDEPTPEVDLARAFPLVTAELRWLRGRVAELEQQAAAASLECTCRPVPYALTPQATSVLAQLSVDKLRGILAPARKAGA